MFSLEASQPDGAQGGPPPTIIHVVYFLGYIIAATPAAVHSLPQWAIKRDSFARRSRKTSKLLKAIRRFKAIAYEDDANTGP